MVIFVCPSPYAVKVYFPFFILFKLLLYFLPSVIEHVDAEGGKIVKKIFLLSHMLSQ